MTASGRIKIKKPPTCSVQSVHVIQPVTEILSKFPSTRYYGSKRKLLLWMFTHLCNLKFESVLDAFGGTATVSLLFKAMHKDVTYHDAFLFNEDVGRTILASNLALSRKEVEVFLNSVQLESAVIVKNFSEIFFTNEENRWLDGFSKKLIQDNLSVEAKALLRYLIYQACLKKRPFNLFHRANLRLRTNHEVHRSFGNARTWERSFIHHALQAYDELVGMPLVKNKGVSILRSGDASRIPSGYDLVYIDPPYVSVESRYNRDNYWRRYHFLEGMARYREWDALIDLESDIRMLEPPSWFKEWSQKSTFKEQLFSFIERHKKSVVVLSYVTNAYPTEKEIIDFFESSFSQVSVHSTEHSHALSRSKKRELLFIGVPC